jgi:hypothetical protein
MKVDFWALWQARVAARVAANTAERTIARYGCEEDLIF